MPTLSHAFEPTLAFYFVPWYRQRRVIETPLTTEQCRERLGARLMSQRDARRGAGASEPPEGRFLVGLLRDASFMVSRGLPGRTRTGTRVTGRLEEGSLGTRVLLNVVPDPGATFVSVWLLNGAALCSAFLALAFTPGHPLGALDSTMTLAIAFGVALAPIGIGIMAFERRQVLPEMVALPEDIGRLLEARPSN